MSARVYKGESIDDGQFPMPPDPRGARGAPDAPGHGAPSAFDGVEPAQLQHTASELQEIVGLVHGMGPAVREIAEQLRGQAAQQGYQEGVARAQHDVHQQLVDSLAVLTGAQAEHRRVLEQQEGALADLALKIARSVIGASLAADPGLVARIVQDTIRDLEPTTSIEVHVHPGDLAAVEASRTEVERLVQGGGTVQIVGDDSVDPGGVILVSPVGQVDARIETKLAVLETAFKAQRRALIDG